MTVHKKGGPITNSKRNNQLLKNNDAKKWTAQKIRILIGKNVNNYNLTAKRAKISNLKRKAINERYQYNEETCSKMRKTLTAIFAQLNVT